MTLKIRVSGLKKTGSWTDIVDHGHHITLAFELENISGADLENWEQWRPKQHDCLDPDMVEKTSEQASLEVTAGERHGSPPLDTVAIAAKKLGAALTSVTDAPEGTLAKGETAITRGAYALWASGRKGFRAIENVVYRRLMTQVSPCYFDTDLVSANLKRTRRFVWIDSEYVLEVKVNDDSLATRIEEHLLEFEDSCEHKCIHTERSDVVGGSAGMPDKRETTESGTTKSLETGPVERPYLCRHCERGLDVQYYICPNCGSYDIQRREWCPSTDTTQ